MFAQPAKMKPAWIGRRFAAIVKPAIAKTACDSEKTRARNAATVHRFIARMQSARLAMSPSANSVAIPMSAPLQIKNLGSPLRNELNPDIHPREERDRGAWSGPVEPESADGTNVLSEILSLLGHHV